MHRRCKHTPCAKSGCLVTSGDSNRSVATTAAVPVAENMHKLSLYKKTASYTDDLHFDNILLNTTWLFYNCLPLKDSLVLP